MRGACSQSKHEGRNQIPGNIDQYDATPNEMPRLHLSQSELFDRMKYPTSLIYNASYLLHKPVQSI
jgi:hypothetical protein